MCVAALQASWGTGRTSLFVLHEGHAVSARRAMLFVQDAAAAGVTFEIIDE